MNKAIFYHIWKASRWRELVRLQLNHIYISGLYDKVDCIHVYANGPEEGLEDVVGGFPKVVIESDTNDATFELETLNALRDYCIYYPEDYVYYMHTKGLSRCSKSVDDWRIAMEFFTIGHNELCTDLLDAGADMVGINLFPGPVIHYSGNFWWAKASYIQTLPPLPVTKYNRMGAEFWPASGKGQFECLHYTKVDHYRQQYPLESYRTIDVLESYRESTETRQIIWGDHNLEIPPILDNFRLAGTA